MATYQVRACQEQGAAPLKKKHRHISQEWLTVLRVIVALNLAGGLFGLIVTFAHFTDAIFLLLPVFVSFALALARSYNRQTFLNTSPRYLFFTIGLTFAYCGVVAGFELLTHLDASLSHTVLVTTTLAWAIILEPVRAYFQARIEQRFNLRNRETARLIEAFISTLREEIDLDQLCERFLAVIRQTMRPYSLSFWVCVASEQQEKSLALEEVTVAGTDPLIAYLLLHPGATEVESLQIETPFLQAIKARGAEILLPLASQGELIGLLALGPHLADPTRLHTWLTLPFLVDPLLLILMIFGLRVDGREYTREERSLLATLAAQVAPALRVAQMVQEQQREVRERERIEQELRTAQAIQRTFLPKDVPTFPGWQLVPYYQPAREVGGDFYDFLPFEDGRLGLVIGDVTDKGIPAAIVMASTRSMLQAAAQASVSPGKVLARVNNLLYADTPARMFVTCFYAIRDPRSGILRYANAGHDLPYQRVSGQVEELLATGMPLGLLPGMRYEEREVSIAPGASVLFYSDGLVEAHNAHREMFGFPRLKTLLTGPHDHASLVDFLLQELRNFTGDEWEQEDDVTLVTLQRIQQTPMSEQSYEKKPGEKLLTCSIASQPGNEQEAMQRVAEVVRPLGFSAERLTDLQSAVAEAVMNAMEHGNHYQPGNMVELQIYASATAVTVRVLDEGGIAST